MAYEGEDIEAIEALSQADALADRGIGVSADDLKRSERAYVSGPMTGIPEFNFPAFDAVAEALRNQGVAVFSPADNDRVRLAGVGIDDITTVGGFDEGNVVQYNAAVGIETSSLLRDDFNFIVNYADYIVLLPGWEQSTGARWERTVAEALNVEIRLADGEPESGTICIEIDPVQQRLTPLLKTFGQAPQELSPDSLSTTSLILALQRRLGHVPGMKVRLESITANLA